MKRLVVGSIFVLFLIPSLAFARTQVIAEDQPNVSNEKPAIILAQSIRRRPTATKALRKLKRAKRALNRYTRTRNRRALRAAYRHLRNAYRTLKRSVR